MFEKVFMQRDRQCVWGEYCQHEVSVSVHSTVHHSWVLESVSQAAVTQGIRGSAKDTCIGGEHLAWGKVAG